MIIESLKMTFAMGWEILWALILGFFISAVIQAVVSKRKISSVLPDDKLKSISLASLFGAASSSCSYAAVAMARSLFIKGANFTSAIVFEIASTNLVIELGIIMALLLGWQFTLAEFIGGPIIIINFTLLAKYFIEPKLIKIARKHADKKVQGIMEGHAHMDMSVQQNGSLLSKIRSNDGKTAISHYFVMDWQAIYKDILLGLLLAGLASVFIPRSFWEAIFFTNNPTLSFIIGPIVGPLVAIISFVCSIGNVPLAAVLWNGGISFGGVISFIFADLIILPIINIYRKYYGWKMAIRITGLMYLAMVFAGYVIEFLFRFINLIPGERKAKIIEASISWNYTTFLNLISILIVALLIYRYKNSLGHSQSHN